MLLNFFLWIIYVYLTFWVAYFLFFAVVAHLRHSRPIGRSWSASFLVLYPAYKEDRVIIESVENALKHNYPNDMFDVLVIADSLKSETIEELRQLGAEVLEVSFERSTKSKSLNAALGHVYKEYDAVVVLDADNHMEPNFLSKMATKYNRGGKAIQGHRTAKNTNTKLAYLDAVSEEVNNHIFRLGHRKVGLSSALIGSGMVFDYTLFKDVMPQVEAVGGFDRELELRLIGQGIKIEYVHDAYILDEKVQRQEVFHNQRRRWLAAQLHYFRRYALSGLKALFRGKLDYANKVVQGIQVPRLLLPGLIAIFGAAAAILSLSPSWIYWLASFVGVVAALMVATPRRFYTKELLKATLELPRTFVSMLGLLFKLRGANKTFIHTEHGKVEKEEKASHSH